MSKKKWALIAFPSGYGKSLTYEIPEGISVSIGNWVLIPLGKREIWGAITALDFSEPTFACRKIIEVYSKYSLSQKVFNRLNWVAEYYFGGMNRALDISFPKDWLKWKRVASTESKINTEVRQAPQLSKTQSESLAKMTKVGSYLLHGVTGSGKTRVYLDLIKKCLAQNKVAILLVPEIGLTPQLTHEIQSYISQEVDVWHSNLSATLRKRTFRRILEHKVKVLLGTRSAIMTPVENLGLVIVDEEHDTSFKQENPTPRYNARDLSLWIGSNENVKVVLGSATPSLDTYSLVHKHKITLVEMKHRVVAKSLPSIKIIDMTQQIQNQGKLLLSFTLRDKIREKIAKQEQIILLVNRRGYATTRKCLDCGEIMKCPDCFMPLVYHKVWNKLVSHYSSRTYPADTPCFSCLSRKYEFLGSAIEKVEEELKEWIPEAKILRLDKDSTSKKNELVNKLDSFRAEHYNVLLGTQMVAKGHDFPKVNLVGVLNVALNSIDFRQGERMFQLLTQVAGRAGRHSGDGEVYIQTFEPKSELISWVQTQDYPAFSKWEMRKRKEANFPPYYRLAMLEGNHKDYVKLKEKMRELKFWVDKNTPAGVLVYGPSSAPIPRLKGMFRMRFLLKSTSSKLLSKLLTEIQNQSAKDIRLSIDMDPQNL